MDFSENFWLLFERKKLRKSCLAFGWEERRTAHLIGALDYLNKENWEKDGNNSLSLCLSKLKNESYLYYNFKELEQYQLSNKQLSLFSSHELWKTNLKVLKLKIWKTLTTKVWNDGGDNSYSFQNVPI